MKKSISTLSTIALSFCFFTFFSVKGYSQNTANSMNDAPVYIYHKYEKSDGRFTIFGPRYKEVDNLDPYCYQDKLSGRIYEIHRTICKGKGWERCRNGAGSIAPIRTNGVTIDGEAIYDIENEIMEQIDSRIAQGEPEGNIVKKVRIPSHEGKNIIFSFNATWNGCDENGNGIIQLHIIDITHEIQTYSK